MARKKAHPDRGSSRAVGRPRALTIEEILDTAIGLGLTGISMPVLAAKLGIATATLYNYVANRSELLRLSALRQAGRPVLDDLGQDWRTYVRTHATRFFEFWASEPQLMDQYMRGAIGPHDLLDYVESFLAAMRRRGFSANQAYRIFSAVNTVVLGAVVRAGYLKALYEQGSGHGARIRRSLQERSPGELPNLRACTEFADDEQAYNFEAALERVIGSFGGPDPP